MAVICEICGKQFDTFRGLNGHRNAHIKRAESYKPPASAVKAAKKGLAQRKEWGRGGLSPSEAKSQGIDSGVTRARKIASGSVSRHDVRRMSAFNRHRQNNRPEKKMPDGGPTAGTIAWNLWGGTSGVNWAKKKSAAMNAEELSKTSCCCGADESDPCACMKAPEPMSCRAKEPKCACYKALEKNAEGAPTADEKCDLDYHLRCHDCRLCLDCNLEADAGGNVCRFCTGESIERFDAETLDYNSFTNDMEALLAKYSQLLLTYDTEYQDGIMEVFMRFKPYNAYFDDVDLDAEEGQLAKALAAVRDKAKRYAPTPLRLTKLPHPDQKTLKDFEADWRDLSRDSSGRWLPAGDDSTVSYDMTDMSWMTPSEYYQYVLEEPLDISDDIEDDTQTIEFQDRFVRYTAMTMSPQVIDALIEENELEIVSDLFADPAEAEGEIAFLKAVKRYQQFSERIFCGVITMFGHNTFDNYSLPFRSDEECNVDKSDFTDWSSCGSVDWSDYGQFRTQTFRNQGPEDCYEKLEDEVKSIVTSMKDAGSDAHYYSFPEDESGNAGFTIEDRRVCTPGSVESTEVEEITGCMRVDAINYNPDATIEDDGFLRICYEISVPLILIS